MFYHSKRRNTTDVVMLISDNLGFRKKRITRDKVAYYTIIGGVQFTKKTYNPKCVSS